MQIENSRNTNKMRQPNGGIKTVRQQKSQFVVCVRGMFHIVHIHVVLIKVEIKTL